MRTKFESESQLSPIYEKDLSCWATVRPRFPSTEYSTSQISGRRLFSGRNGNLLTPQTQTLDPQLTRYSNFRQRVETDTRDLLSHLDIRERVHCNLRNRDIRNACGKGQVRHDHIPHMPVQKSRRADFL